MWSGEVATRHNDDGSVALIMVDPDIAGLDFVVGADGETRTLTVRDRHHAYRFVEPSR